MKTDNRKYYPLTHAQKRIYYDDKLHPNTSASTQAFIVRYNKILDRVLLEKAINKVILKNEGFRLRIMEFDFEPEPSQYIFPYKEISLDHIDFSGPMGERRLKEWTEKITQKTIDLIDRDLFYFSYIRFNENESGYYLKFHHIASDGGSYPLIFAEINQIYNDLETGRTIDESPNPSYLSYITDEHEYLNSDQVAKDREFWHNYLLPLPEATNLTGTGSPDNIRGTVFVTSIPDSLRSMIVEYCATNNRSLFKLFLSALATYVTRATEREEIIIAGTNHNRYHTNPKRRKELEKSVGMFVSTIPFRVKASTDMAFNEFVEKTGKNINHILKKHSAYPFDRLVTEIREIAGTEIVHMLDFLISGHGNVAKEPFVFEHIYQGYQGNALTIHINYNNKDIDGILELEYEYQLARFSESDVSRFHLGIVNVLYDALSFPGKKLSELELLSAEEKRIILHEFNDSAISYPRDKTIQELFETHVEKTPENIAIKYKNERLTYQELNEISNQLARVLRKKGIKPDNLVGIMLERSIEMMIGILGILKSGGAYLPINPDYPTDRIHYLLKDSSAKLLLTQEKFIQFSETFNYEGEVINLENKSLSQGDKTNLDNVNSPEDLAYIIYTSGSTGMPKGVLIEHVSAINTLLTLNKKYPLDASDTYLLKTSFMFDVSVSEIFGWFWGGGSITVLEPGGEKDPQLILDSIESDRITHLNFVPSMFNLFVNVLDSQNIAKMRSLKYIFLAGEAIWPDSIIKFRYLDSKVIIENIYGPTEASIYATRFPLAKWKRLGCVPIGVPIDNTKLFILSSESSSLLALKGVGIPGELCISGIGLARGYLNRPELTAEKFADNPFTEAEGWDRSYSKLYRTGDLCRWQSDGDVEYMGRIDFQVKVRGFRIELGEIEAFLSGIEEIKEAVVLAREDSGGEKYLCAYIVSNKEVNIPVLKKTLAKSIPEYMIPSHFMQLEKIPLNPSGKIDRKALPAPTITEKGADYQEAQNEIEGKLVGIWSELLHIKKDIISIDDSFFKLGGHSLKVALMIVLIHKELNVKVLMHEVFELSTIRKLAEYIRNAKREMFVSIEKAPKREFYPQTSAQKRMYFMAQLETDSILYNLQLMDVYCKGIDKNRLERAFRMLIERHESLRTSFLTVEGEPVQKIHDFEEVGANFEIEYYETSEDGLIYSDMKGKEWTKVTGVPFQDVVEHFVRPFDLTKPPLIRVGMVKIWGNTKILMLDMHHIVSDGTSLVILIKDLWMLYDGEVLPELKIQYKDYAGWCNLKLQQEEVEQKEAFWLREFSGELPLLNLPIDFPRPAVQTFEGDMLHFEIGKEETHRLNMMGHEHGETLYMVLLAVYNVLLAKLSGQQDISIGTFTAGRGHADLQNIIGMFVDTLVLRNYPEGDRTFKEFLKDVKARTINAFENQDYPLEKLVSKVAATQQKNRNPLFDVTFGLDNEAERSEDYLLDVLILDKSNPYKPKRAKFDMMLMGAETEEGLQFIIEYSTALFKEETIERFVKYFKKIVSSVSTDIWQRLSEIEIISLEEKLDILYIFNDTEAEYEKDKTIFQVFEEQVEKTPDNIAVIFQDCWLSYREFNGRVNQLTRLFREKGVIPDTVVAIMIERCFEMMIGIFAIQKAGGAYLPIEPKFPYQRVDYLLKDSSSKFLLTLGKFSEKVEAVNFNGEVIYLENKSLYQGDKTNPELVNTPRDIAYIIYTSGSTGKPKGVMIEHFSVINRINWMHKMYPIDYRSVILQKTTFVFDVSVWELFWWSFKGSAQYLLIPGGEKDPALIIEAIEKHNISQMHFVPSMLNVFLGYIEMSDSLYKSTSLRHVFASGEALTAYQAAKFNELVYERTKKAQLINFYGPTEAAVDVSYFDCPTNQKAEKIPIGKPVDNTHLLVVTSKIGLQPIKVAGELCITGDQLARGYLNRPELTAEKFIDNPFYTESNWGPMYKKLYRTGDLAHWLPDGNIEYLGRIDFQVKVRGFRIELGEIESRLLEIKEIKETVVLAKDDSKGDKYLCAWFVAAGTVDLSLLRKALLKNMPDYMIPSYFVQIDEIPLTPNGKLDRKALPEPEAKAESEYIAPTNETEKILAEVWAQVLGMEKVGIDDNFFDIGGDSLKTILISGKLQKKNKIVSINDFFKNPTIRQLALCARDSKRIEGNIAQDIVDRLTQLSINNWIDEQFVHVSGEIRVIEEAFNLIHEQIKDGIGKKVGEMVNKKWKGLFAKFGGDKDSKDNREARKKFECEISEAIGRIEEGTIIDRVSRHLASIMEIKLKEGGAGLVEFLKEKNHDFFDKELQEGREKSNGEYQLMIEENLPDLSDKNRYENILLTGSTGYLGTYLTVELMRATLKNKAILHLPVRGKTLEEAQKRFKDKISHIFGETDFNAIKERVKILRADLTEERFGMSEDQYNDLANTVDAVVHSAALVKHYGEYQDLYKNNVEVTERLLKFALKGKKKDFHFISTVDVGRGVIQDRNYLLFTEFCHNEGQVPEHLYIKSKLEAENKVIAYRIEGLNTSIYRVGNLTFDRGWGYFQENIKDNFFYSLVKSVIKVGLISENMRELAFDLSYVDLSARFIVALLRIKNLANKTFHIFNPNRLPMMEMIELLKKADVEVGVVEKGRISGHLESLKGNEEAEKIIHRMQADSWVWDEIPATRLELVNDWTVMLLKKLGYCWPEVDKQQIKKMIAYGKDVGFL